MTTADSLTLGGLAISLAVLYANLRTWWKGSRDFKTLGPFASGFGFGAVATVCAGGLLGVLAGCSAGATNTVGNKATPGVTGTDSGSALASRELGRLTEEGGVVVLVAAVALFIAWRAAGKDVKKRMFGGLLCGSTLCLTAGVAGLMVWLPDAVNQLGTSVRATIEGGLV